MHITQNFLKNKAESHYVAQAGLELLGSKDPPALTSWGAGITGVNHQVGLYPELFFFAHWVWAEYGVVVAVGHEGGEASSQCLGEWGVDGCY